MNEKKSKLITCRLTESEHLEYLSIFRTAKTSKKKYTTSDFIRDCIFNKELPKGLKVVRVKSPSPCKKQRLQMLISTVNNIDSLAKSLFVQRQNQNFNLNECFFKLEEIQSVLKGELS